MKNKSNPFSTAFGMVPPLYVLPAENNYIEDVVKRLNAEPVAENAFMLYGIRGSGKTVALTAIEEKIASDDKWIIIDLNSQSDLMTDLVAKLYDTDNFVGKFIATELNLSMFGIGLNIDGKKPAASLESSLEKIMNEIRKKNKKLLVTIDEASKTPEMLKFAGCFNLLSRKRYPIYLLMTGLPVNLSRLEDAKDMTFLRRAYKINVGFLNSTLVNQKYKEVFNIENDKARELMLMTKRYPFAFQVLGKLLWEHDTTNISDEIVSEFDYYMDVNVYDKMWQSLTETEKWYLGYLSAKENMKVSELLEITKKKANDFSRFRKSLMEKGVICSPGYGEVAFLLPRFREFVIERMLDEGREVVDY